VGEDSDSVVELSWKEAVSEDYWKYGLVVWVAGSCWSAECKVQSLSDSGGLCNS
jgi:hypothetical protein